MTHRATMSNDQWHEQWGSEDEFVPPMIEADWGGDDDGGGTQIVGPEGPEDACFGRAFYGYGLEAAG